MKKEINSKMYDGGPDWYHISTPFKFHRVFGPADIEGQESPGHYWINGVYMC